MEKVMFYLSDLIDKAKEYIVRFLSAVPGETLVTLILAAIAVIYFLKASKDKVKRAVTSKRHKTQQRLCMEELEMQLQFFFGFMTGGNKPAFIQACKSYMKKNNYKMSRSTVKQMIHDNMWVWKNKEKQKKGYLADEKADKMIDAVYKFMQLGFEEGPEYEKLQKKIKASIKHNMKDATTDISSTETEKIKESIMKDNAFSDSNLHSQQVMDDMNRHMQEHMMHDMNMQMQQQMMNDMQMQMQQQMMQDMQMQMQMQMMQDMQMQMQMQMMNDMQMQMQNQMMNDMNQQMLNSMNDANMAMTSTDFGGHMNSDMNSGNFGMF